MILTNPPFGGKEGKEAQTRFAYKTGATQVLFLQHVIDALKPGGRCGIVLDEGVLFRTNETAFVQTKRKLLDDCDLWCICQLPPGVFSSAGAGVKTNLLFFTKGGPTERIWYYDLSDIKVRQEDAADARPLRGVLRAAAGAGRQRAQLDGDPRGDRGPRATTSRRSTRTRRRTRTRARRRSCSTSSRPRAARSTRRSRRCGGASPKGTDHGHAGLPVRDAAATEAGCRR